MNGSEHWLRDNWPIALVILVGGAIVFAIGFVSDSMSAVLVSGLIVGILVGGLISIMSRDKSPKRKRRR